MDIIKYDVYRGSNLGVYVAVNDSVALVPMGFAGSKAERIAGHMGVECMSVAIANTRLIGSLSVMNNRGMLIPKTAFENEYEALKGTGLEVGVLDSRFTALGNIICANDRGAVVSPGLSAPECRTVSDVLGVEVCRKRIAGFSQAGAVMVANNRGAVVHPEADEDDMEEVGGVLGVRVEHSSINNGVPYVSSGLLANNRNLLVGSLTTGPEIMMLTRAFLS